MAATQVSFNDFIPRCEQNGVSWLGRARRTGHMGSTSPRFTKFTNARPYGSNNIWVAPRRIAIGEETWRQKNSIVVLMMTVCYYTPRVSPQASWIYCPSFTCSCS